MKEGERTAFPMESGPRNEMQIWHYSIERAEASYLSELCALKSKDSIVPRR